MTPRTILLSLFLLSCGGFLFAAEDVKAPRIGEHETEANSEEKGKVSIDEVKIRRTTVFDEAEIKKLYKDHKARNDKMNEGLPAHLNSEEMELVTLRTMSVEGSDLRMQRKIVERLDPKPRQRLARIADIDPDAAHEMMVTMRNDQEFMSGANDRRRIAGDPGGTANFNSSQMSGALDKAFSALSKALGGRKKSEDESE